MLLSFREVIDIVLMSVVIGFIFMDYFRLPKLNYYEIVGVKRRFLGFDKDAFLISTAVIAPSIILHEFGHKFTAMAFGYYATFHAAYIYLGIGLFLKLIGSPFIFFVPAYVSIPSAMPPLASSLVAFMGPFVNIILWLFSFYMLENHAKTKKQAIIWAASKRINGFLAIFNLLPIPGFDGFHVLMGLIRAVA